MRSLSFHSKHASITQTRTLHCVSISVSFDFLSFPTSVSMGCESVFRRSCVVRAQNGFDFDSILNHSFENQINTIFPVWVFPLGDLSGSRFIIVLSIAMGVASRQGKKMMKCTRENDKNVNRFSVMVNWFDQNSVISKIWEEFWCDATICSEWSVPPPVVKHHIPEGIRRRTLHGVNSSSRSSCNFSSKVLSTHLLCVFSIYWCL